MTAILANLPAVLEHFHRSKLLTRTASRTAWHFTLHAPSLKKTFEG